MTIEDSLAHYGKLGMKWGKRNTSTSTGSSGGGTKTKAPRKRGAIRRGLTKAGVALDASKQVSDEGEKKLIFLPDAYRRQAASGARSRVLGEARRINKDPKFHGKDLKTNPKLKEAYHKELTESAKSIYAEELSTARTNATFDFIETMIPPRGDRMTFSAPSDRLRHAEGKSEVLLTLKLTRDNLDHIIDMQIIENDDDLEQFDLDEEYLQHVGVFGMKWGRSRAKGNSYDVRAARSRVAGQSIKLEGAKKKASRIKDPKERTKAKSEVAKMKISNLNNPDRVLAARLTTGEKWIAALFVPGGITAIGVTSARSRRIERKQEKGKYNK